MFLGNLRNLLGVIVRVWLEGLGSWYQADRRGRNGYSTNCTSCAQQAGRTWIHDLELKTHGSSPLPNTTVCGDFFHNFYQTPSTFALFGLGALFVCVFNACIYSISFLFLCPVFSGYHYIKVFMTLFVFLGALLASTFVFFLNQ